MDGVRCMTPGVGVGVDGHESRSLGPTAVDADAADVSVGEVRIAFHGTQ